jgi:hypothetical protein
MALANVNIKRQDGGIVRQGESQDGISALVIYSTALSGYAGDYKWFSEQESVDLLTGGTSDEKSVIYHLNSYYNRSNEPIYVKIVGSATTTFDEVVEMKDFAEGEPRIYGVLDFETVFSTARLDLINGQANVIEGEFAPGQFLYSAGIAGNVEALTDLKLLTSPRASFLIGEDLSTDSEAKAIREGGASFVGNIGEALGVLSDTQVSTSIAYVRENDLSGFGYGTPGFIDGSLYKSKATPFLDTLDSYNYIFVRKFVGLGGSYFNFGSTAVNPVQSDFSTIELNRTYDKAYRNLRTALLVEVCAPALVDANGDLSLGFVKHLETLAGSQLQFMKNAEEISDYLVTIDKSQKVLETNTIEVVAKIVPVGVAKFIEVKLGFNTKL